MIKTLAITGGTGFVGSKLIDLALLHKYQVRALTRRVMSDHGNLLKRLGEA